MLRIHTRLPEREQRQNLWLWAARVWLCAHTHTSAHISASVIACARGWNCPKSHTRRLCKLAISMQDEKSLWRDILVCLLYAFIPRVDVCWAESWGSKEQWHLSRTRSLSLPHGRHFYFVLLQYTVRALFLSRTHTRPYKCMHNAALLFAF